MKLIDWLFKKRIREYEKQLQIKEEDLQIRDLTIKHCNYVIEELYKETAEKGSKLEILQNDNQLLQETNDQLEKELSDLHNQVKEQ